MEELINTFANLKTPFFWYDMDLLTETLDLVKNESEKYGFHIHYAVKANANKRILSKIQQYNFGADCVSGNEVLQAVKSGFPSQKIVFAGVGKSDEEINIGLDKKVFTFNVESIQEMQVINQLAREKGLIASIALRLNPNVDAATHQYITTGLTENKFGINLSNLEKVFTALQQLDSIDLKGIHFHIGSQITNFDVFKNLALRVNEIQEIFIRKGIDLKHINLGGGLGINYDVPCNGLIPDFKTYFKIFADNLKIKSGQQVHFELGRSIVAQCGNLVTKTLYIKEGTTKDFVIVDAGLTELIRPALYQAKHKVLNISSDKEEQTYDVVGPICESADVFRKDIQLPKTKRGDLMMIKSVGAYGQVMTSRYNLRDIAKAYYSDEVSSEN
jgi:diaminopimelate decarboxylase